MLGALGMTRRERFILALTRVALVSTTGATIAIALAVAASPLFPIGLARDAEPTPGLALDATVLAAGFGVVAVGFLLLGALPAWHRACRDLAFSASLSRRAGIGRVFPDTLGRTGLRPAPMIGVRMAFEPGTVAPPSRCGAHW